MFKKNKTSFIQIFSLCITIFLCLCVVPISIGEIYKWRDEQGRLHFTDSEQNIPPQYREQVKEYDDSTITRPTTENSKEIKETKEESKSISQDTIRIPFVSSEGLARRVIIEVNFNRRVSAPILVDTGAPCLVLSAELAIRLGLFDQRRSNLWVSIGGIGGEEFAIRTIVDQIKIGDITEKFIPAYIVADLSGNYEGLLGMDILSRYTLTIDSANNQLIANVNPGAQNLPAGRDQFWWESVFKEFRYHKKFWEDISERLDKEQPPFSRMIDSSREQLAGPVNYQKREAQKLLDKLNRYARWNAVPNHWRK